jgi:hypothetical protein
MKSGACRTTLVWDRSVTVLGQPYKKVRAMSVFSIITLMVFSPQLCTAGKLMISAAKDAAPRRLAARHGPHHPLRRSQSLRRKTSVI